MQHHKDIYVVIDSECSEKDDKITEIIQSVFKNPYVINENIKITICKSKTSAQEKSQDNVFIVDYPQCANIDYPQKELSNTLAVTQEELVHDKTDQPDA